MTAGARDDRTGAFVDACIDDVAKARSLAAADPTLLSKQWMGDPLLHWMVIEDFVSGAALLLDLGVPVDLPDENGVTALHQAAKLGRLGCVRLLLERGADPNAYNEHFGENPLDRAVFGGHVGVVSLLLEHGARGDYQLTGSQTVFSSMQSLRPETRTTLVEMLAARGVTRDGLFESLRLRDFGYESPEEAYGW